MYCKLAGLNPIVLEFWQSVLFSSDELVDIAVVELCPQVFVLFCKIIKFGVLTVQEPGCN